MVFAFPENELLAENIMAGMHAEKGNYILRQFPDGETYLRILSEVEGKEAVLVCTLNRPDDKLLSLLFFCRQLKELKAASICLVAPYMAYMRQDKAFNPGEAITSVYFARLISSFADRLITIDPHLHRRRSMQEIYSIPCEVLHTTTLISTYIKEHIANALLIGPDSESEQWVSGIAKEAGVPFIILQKTRRGDTEVEVSIPEVENYEAHVPVVIDDIISTAHTMMETISHLKKKGMPPPVCIGVHAVFTEETFNQLLNSGAKEVITCNTIAHSTNRIEISQLIISTFKNRNHEHNRI